MERILVVDDDLHIRNICKRFLMSAGYEVTTVSDGKQAIDIIEAISFDLVITDIFMPEEDGLGLLLYISANRPGLRSIVMTGGPKDIDLGKVYLEDAIAFGASSILKKPFEKKDLEDAVKNVLTG